MGRIDDRIRELGWVLPETPAPLAAYVPAVRTGSLVFSSGQLPLADGELLAAGMVADSPEDEAIEGWIINQAVIGIDVAQRCAAQCALNAVAAIKGEIGDLDLVTRIVKVSGFVCGVDGFTGHPQVVNGASEWLADVWLDRGAHARSAVGVAHLPLGAPVEVEIIVEVAV